MLRYSKLDDIWDDKNLYGLPNNNVQSKTNGIGYNSLQPTINGNTYNTEEKNEYKNNSPFLSRAFHEPPSLKNNMDEMTKVNTCDTNSLLVYSLVQEIKNKDQQLQYERKKKYKLKEQKLREQYGLTNEYSKKEWHTDQINAKSISWLWPILILFIVFAVYVVISLKKLDSKCSRMYQVPYAMSGQSVPAYYP